MDRKILKQLSKPLNDLAKLPPEEYNEALRALVNNADENVRRFFIDLDDSIKAAAAVSIKGFEYFYRKLYNREIPYVDIPVVEEFVKAYHAKTGVIYVSWRGRGKSTFLRAWVAYITGVNPVGSAALVRINDQAAKRTGKLIAEIIQTSPVWKDIFPHVIPDIKAGWSVEDGFNVMDLRVVGTFKSYDDLEKSDGYAKWRQMCISDHGDEKSLMCAGIESGTVIGLHPTNGEWFDDLHDENNTRSQAEMQRVVDTFDGNIIGTLFSAGQRPPIGVFCTLWNKKDVYHRMMETGLFKVINTPIFSRDENGIEIPVLDEDGISYYPLGYKVRLTWPERFTAEMIGEIWRANPVRFGQGYLGDLDTMKGKILKLDWWHPPLPLEKIDPLWKTVFGVDFASSDGNKDNKRDFFATAFGRATGDGRLVIEGGIRRRLSTVDALERVKDASRRYVNFGFVGVEKYGKGEEFFNNIVAYTDLPAMKLPQEGTLARDKNSRYIDELVPDVVSGRIILSDVQDEFLRVLLDEWVGWDGNKSKSGHDDCLDALYYCWLTWKSMPTGVAEYGEPLEMWRG